MGTAPRDRLTAWGLVGVQAILIAAVVVFPRDPSWFAEWPIVVGNALVGLALVVGVWGSLRLGRGLTPSPLPNGAIELVTRGPYRWIRHPLYTSVIVGMFGIALRTRTPIVIALSLVFVPFFMMKARWEERHLMATFDGYAEYARRTGRFVPDVGSIKD